MKGECARYLFLKPPRIVWSMIYDVQNLILLVDNSDFFSQTSKCEVAVYRLTLYYLNSTRKWRL